MKQIVLILFLLPWYSHSQETIKVKKAEKKFALQVVKAIIEHDCETYYNSINDRVVLYLRVEDTLIAKSDIQNKLKMLCQISVQNDTLDYAYYLDNFELQFFDATTLADQEFYGNSSGSSTLGTLKYYNIKKGDIMFYGAEHKTRNRMDFILDDAFKFLFRKIDAQYKIILMMN